ncbi:hypothetical protein EKD04_009605 [Chloroflexales bacterium ZM16-3]|nr:hypothetical protein [Chloroflexales bacterium ZM16-3]
MPGHNGGFNPFRGPGGQFGTGPGGSTGGSTGGKSRSVANKKVIPGGAVPGEVGTRAERFTPQGLIPRKGGAYRTAATVARDSKAPANPKAPLSSKQRQLAHAIVNAYASTKLPKTADHHAIVKGLRSTLSSKQPEMSQEEVEQANALIAHLTT